LPLIPLHLLLPLVSAVVYVVAALLLKRAADLGAGVWRTTRIINYTSALVAMPLWLLGGTIPAARLWWQPAVGGALFFAGQIFTLLALSTGDVSVATPVLGVKILLVALLSAVLIGDPIGARLWTAAALSSAAIVMLNFSRPRTHTRVSTTIVLAALGAAAYACFDVLVQKWSPVWGSWVVPIAMACAAAYSLPLRRFDARKTIPSEEILPACTPWVIGGAACFAVQGLMFITSISVYGQATSANVLYSSRGLWSVVAVWGIGHWFTNREQHLGAPVLAWRLVGAILMMAALMMVLVG